MRDAKKRREHDMYQHEVYMWYSNVTKHIFREGTHAKLKLYFILLYQLISCETRAPPQPPPHCVTTIIVGFCMNLFLCVGECVIKFSVCMNVVCRHRVMPIIQGIFVIGILKDCLKIKMTQTVPYSSTMKII